MQRLSHENCCRRHLPVPSHGGGCAATVPHLPHHMDAQQRCHRLPARWPPSSHGRATAACPACHTDLASTVVVGEGLRSGLRPGSGGRGGWSLEAGRAPTKMGASCARARIGDGECATVDRAGGGGRRPGRECATALRRWWGHPGAGGPARPPGQAESACGGRRWRVGAWRRTCGLCVCGQRAAGGGGSAGLPVKPLRCACAYCQPRSASKI
ncbi:hypothetical protein GUJ93_ZPchr0002g25379 [Zizania palustris]|uniref:Uncharacterized protein n=1 Tax=Zizania palustris TaxID=103762 RepID=A0A8J5S2R1_ZIZPA|nr:hypothetical protein GUJ93_ZPchr0002g25379 [Zizania palustris]